jgi:Flp pilus assembly protein TadG
VRGLSVLSLIRRKRERGTVAVLVAVLMGGAALLGMGALVLDIGQVYTEHEQLQNAADSVAVNVAQACIKKPSGCNSQVSTAATAVKAQFADNNAKDGKTKITEVCSGPSSGLPSWAPTGLGPACSTLPTNLAKCIGTVDTTRPYVEVRTSTEMTDGTYALPPTFAGVFTGGAAQAKTVHACGRAQWAPAVRVRAESMVMSLCEYKWAVTQQGGLYDAPGYLTGTPKQFVIYPRFTYPNSVSPPNKDTPIKLVGSASSSGCAVNHTGSDVGTNKQVSGWDFVEPDPADIVHCRTPVSIGDTLVAKSDNPDDYTSSNDTPSHRCKGHLWSNTLAAPYPDALFIPIYDTVAVSSGLYRYHIVGFAGWVSTGYYGWEDWEKPSSITGVHYCGPSVSGGNSHDQCMYGYFSYATQYSSYAQNDAAGTNYGGFVVKSTG